MFLKATNKPNIIVASLGYHGRTAGTMGMTTSGCIYRSGFFPQSNGVFVTAFPYMTNGPFGPTYASNSKSDYKSVAQSMYWGSCSHEVAALDTVRCCMVLQMWMCVKD